MWLPPVVISVVVLFAVLHVLIEYPVALVPLCLHPLSDWPKMCVCVFVLWWFTVGVLENVCLVVHDCVAQFVS